MAMRTASERRTSILRNQIHENQIQDEFNLMCYNCTMFTRPLHVQAGNDVVELIHHRIDIVFLGTDA